MSKTGGVGQTLLNVLKHPVTLGTTAGGAGGAGLGYLSAPEDEKLRGTLVGAGTGAAIGGLTGGLSTLGSRNLAEKLEMVQAQAAKAVDDAGAKGIEIGRAEGINEGAQVALNNLANNPSMASKLVSQMHPEGQVQVLSSTLRSMEPELRAGVLKEFRSKGWLERMFGG